MANITEEHLHHMARRHHATIKQLDGIKERIGGILGRGIDTIEYGLASWVGGAIEGRTDGGTIPFIKLPWNLGAGLFFLTLGHLEVAGKHSEHLSNFGNGFLGSFVAAEGYAFGKRWKDTGKVFGGGAAAFTHPYEVSGDLSQAQMAAIVSRMRQAANAPAHQ